MTFGVKRGVDRNLKLGTADIEVNSTQNIFETVIGQDTICSLI